MKAGAQLAVGRMSNEALWRRAKGALAILDPQVIPLNGSERARRRGAYNEVRAILAELEMRGVQMRLPL